MDKVCMIDMRAARRSLASFGDRRRASILEERAPAASAPGTAG